MLHLDWSLLFCPFFFMRILGVCGIGGVALDFHDF